MVTLSVVLLTVGGAALLAALTPLLIELAALVAHRSRLPLPSTRQSSRYFRLRGGSLKRSVKPLPVKPVRRLVFVAQEDDVDPLFCTYTLMGRDADTLAILKQGHCVYSELPLVLSSLLSVWEKWIDDPASAPGVTSL